MHPSSSCLQPINSHKRQSPTKMSALSRAHDLSAPGPPARIAPRGIFEPKRKGVPRLKHSPELSPWTAIGVPACTVPPPFAIMLSSWLKYPGGRGVSRAGQSPKWVGPPEKAARCASGAPQSGAHLGQSAVRSGGFFFGEMRLVLCSMRKSSLPSFTPTLTMPPFASLPNKSSSAKGFLISS